MFATEFLNGMIAGVAICIFLVLAVSAFARWYYRDSED